MKFSFGFVGANDTRLDLVRVFVVARHQVRPKIENGRILEFDAGSFWEGMDITADIGAYLRGTFDIESWQTGIWVNGQTLQVFLAKQLQKADAGMEEAIRLLKQGRTKKSQKNNEKSEAARIKLEATLKYLRTASI